MTIGDTENRGADQLVARIMSGVIGLLYFVALALPWTDPPFSNATAEWYTGWGLMGAGLGGSTADNACGQETCPAGAQFLMGGMPALAVLAAAIAMLFVLSSPSSRRTTVAIWLNVLTLLGLLGEWVVLAAASSQLSNSSNYHNLKPGMLVTAILAVAAISVLVSWKLAPYEDPA